MKSSVAFLTSLLLAVSGVEAKPLKVFILAGQSNMEGPANISTFDYIGDDPVTAPLLKMMRGADGKPAEGKGLPEPLGAESFIFLRTPGSSMDPISPVIHLQRLDRLINEDSSPEPNENCTLVAEVICRSQERFP